MAHHRKTLKFAMLVKKCDQRLEKKWQKTQKEANMAQDG
jgi:hypothetical protein